MNSSVSSQSSQHPNVTLTPAAQKQVVHLLEKNGNQAAHLRVYIIGGGCSGFQYGFKLDTELNSDDIILEQKTESITLPLIKIVIDALSFQYLIGSEIDYVLNLQGARYVVRNPNAETTCGCGSSFSLKEEENS
jgi:iron-sulfur cluster insertion protein